MLWVQDALGAGSSHTGVRSLVPRLHCGLVGKRRGL